MKDSLTDKSAPWDAIRTRRQAKQFARDWISQIAINFLDSTVFFELSDGTVRDDNASIMMQEEVENLARRIHCGRLR